GGGRRHGSGGPNLTDRQRAVQFHVDDPDRNDGDAPVGARGRSGAQGDQVRYQRTERREGFWVGVGVEPCRQGLRLLGRPIQPVPCACKRALCALGIVGEMLLESSFMKSRDVSPAQNANFYVVAR
ncbi:MAG TPA: hypothetical protein PKV55_16315, partial [Nitrospira sp.]|nr:hypothetical protein [Nitrospira sp.]